MLRYCILVGLLLFSSTPVFADLEITEIMYDLEGTDSGYEWIEIQNTGTSSVDAGAWYFFVNDVHHGMYSDTSSLLVPGARAIVASNTTSFAEKFNTSVSIFKSSFSLNNTGERLALSNPKKEVVFSYTYSSELGANGDGYSLQNVNGNWRSGIPTPGASNQQNVQSVQGTHIESEDSDNDDEDIQAQSVSDVLHDDTRRDFQEYYDPFIIFPETVVAGSPIRFIAGVYKITERRRIKKLGGVYELNFGDGALRVSDERIDYAHRYLSPGRYRVNFRYFSNSLAQENGDDPDASTYKYIDVIHPDIHIREINEYHGIVLENHTSEDISLDHWLLSYGDYDYVIPQQTMIVGDSTMVIPSTLLGTTSFTSRDSSFVILENDHGRVISRYLPLSQPLYRETTNVHNNTLDATIRQQVHNTSIDTEIDLEEGSLGQGSDVVTIGEGADFLDQFLEAHPSKEAISFGIENSLEEKDEPNPPIDYTHPLESPIVSIVSVLGILSGGFIGTHYLRRRS